jgi:mannose-1-phosphate guanylyltransferase
MDHFYALIMAGGGGTRLWPLSRRNRPKQMLPLVSEESLFRVSVMRLAALFPPERIFVVTGKNQVDSLQADVRELPKANFIGEPFGQDSGPAAALGVQHITSLDPHAVIAILTADHYISDVWGFNNCLRAAYHVAQQGYIVTLGIKPTFPATGFGYIQQDGLLSETLGLSVYHSGGFKEKPSAEVAQQFLESGRYSWNSGMFIWAGQQALAEFARQQPAIEACLQPIRAAFGTPHYPQAIQSAWEKMPKISLDYAVMEQAQHMAMIPVDIGWSDIGSWAAVYDELPKDPHGNVLQGAGQHLAIESHGSLVNSPRLVVTIGLDDVVVVDAEDVIMVCRRDRAQDVKQAVEQLKKQGLDRYL